MNERHDTDPSELAPSDEFLLTEVPPYEPIPGAPPWFNEGDRRHDQRIRDSEARTRRWVQRLYDRGFQNHEYRIGKLEQGHKRHARRLRLVETFRVHVPLASLVLSTVAVTLAVVVFAMVQ